MTANRENVSAGKRPVMLDRASEPLAVSQESRVIAGAQDLCKASSLVLGGKYLIDAADST